MVERVIDSEREMVGRCMINALHVLTESEGTKLWKPDGRKGPDPRSKSHKFMRRRDRKEVMTTGTRAVQRGGVQGVLKVVGVGRSWSNVHDRAKKSHSGDRNKSNDGEHPCRTERWRRGGHAELKVRGAGPIA